VRRFLVLVPLLLIGCGGGDAPSKEDCHKVVDHMIDVMTAPRSQDKETLQAVDAWKRALKGTDPSRQNLMDLCTKAMKTEHVPCVLEAKDEGALAKCLGASGV
jgi:hypothetical protein